MESLFYSVLLVFKILNYGCGKELHDNLETLEKQLSPYVATIYGAHGRLPLGGGVIVHEKYILTAAHIFTPFLTTRMTWTTLLRPKALLGKVDGEHGRYPIVDVMIHPKFGIHPAPMFNIALAKLDKCIQLGNDSRKANIWNGKPFSEIAEFGMFSYTELNGKDVFNKQWVRHSNWVRILSKYKCLGASNFIPRFEFDQNYMLCGTSIDSTKIKFGSGLMSTNQNVSTVIGVYVMGPKNPTEYPKIASFFLRVDTVQNFLLPILMADSSCETK